MLRKGGVFPKQIFVLKSLCRKYKQEILSTDFPYSLNLEAKTEKRAFHYHEEVEATNYKAHPIYCSKEKAHTKDL